LRLDRVRFPPEARDFRLRLRIEEYSGARPASRSSGAGGCFSKNEVTMAQRWLHCLRAKVKDESNCTSMPAIRLHSVDRGNFTFRSYFLLEQVNY